MKKLVTIFVLTLILLSAVAQQNAQLAESEWVSAEQAFAEKRYGDALRHLDKTQEYVGYWLYTVSHLRILCYDRLGRNDNLATEVQRYMDYANNNSNTADFDHDRFREVYTMHQKIEYKPEYNEGLRLYNAGDYAQSFVKFQAASEKGSDGAMWTLGVMYQDGLGVVQDIVEAARWYRKAAEKGHADAMYTLGQLYYEGASGSFIIDHTQAFEWFRKGAELNHTYAMAYLGYLYYNGHGVTLDYTKALEWSKKAADNGYERSMYYVGYMYANGQGVTQDRNEAIKWMRMAADRGVTGAKEWLAENVR